ncbi:MAG: UDP-N-acetylmuramate dehydrogenase [Firmicutes bacterium]|nr:UDP-N-acetylmuramate dehydrogenase [Bacillota bacterium]
MRAEAVRETLAHLIRGEVRLNEPLARHTTLHVGGPADLYIQPSDRAEVILVVRYLIEHDIPWMPLGQGSDLLVSDAGLRCAVVRSGKALRSLQISGGPDHTLIVHAGAGLALPVLAQELKRRGGGGMTFAAGIPGSVGGGIFMNAGAHGGEMKDCVVQVTAVDRYGSIQHYASNELAFAYRHSRFHEDPGFILEAVFQVPQVDPQALAKEMDAHLAYRRATQPLALPSAGSTFRNPPGEKAGRLIEAVGLKGYRIGDAQFSTLHANFIVNLGHATAAQVLALMACAQRRVFEQFGIHLEPELRVLGEP